jgi:hypothetical protein
MKPSLKSEYSYDGNDKSHPIEKLEFRMFPPKSGQPSPDFLSGTGIFEGFGRTAPVSE